ncbi:MAG: DNA-binding response OmpR family regulator, partial [Patiriisocius sp.]
MEKQRVLLAEDDFDFGSILKQYLEIHNFEVRWAHDGQEALEIFKEHTSIFDICVFDVMMPKMDGFMLAEKVLSIDSEIPFIFLTAKKMKDDRVKGLRLGADDYIIKPFEADILVLRLQNILKRVQRVQVSVKKATSFAIGA